MLHKSMKSLEMLLLSSFFLISPHSCARPAMEMVVSFTGVVLVLRW